MFFLGVTRSENQISVFNVSAEDKRLSTHIVGYWEVSLFIESAKNRFLN